MKYLRIHNTHLQEYYQENNAASISDLQVSIETLEKDHEISILTQEKASEKLKRERLRGVLAILLVLTSAIIVLIVKRQKEKHKREKLEREKLQLEIDKSNEDLYKQTIHMIHVNNCLNEIEEEIKGRSN